MERSAIRGPSAGTIGGIDPGFRYAASRLRGAFARSPCSLSRYGLVSPRGATRALPMTATNTAPAAMRIVANTVCLLLPLELGRAAVPLALARLTRSRLQQ